MIVGLAGSYGAGKGTVVSYLIRKGFTHYSASGFIKEEIIRRGLSVDRDAMIRVGNELRAAHGPAHIIESLYTRAQNESSQAIIESLRARAEVRHIRQLGGIVIGVDADPKVRYARAHARGSEKDNVSFERFLEQEREESNAEDPTKQDIFGALKESDFLLTNNGSVEDLFEQIDRVLVSVMK